MAEAEEWAVPEHLTELLNEDREAGTDLIQVFIDDSATQLSALEAALVGEDAARAARILHSLRGSCAQMGALRMAEVCAEAETAIQSAGLAVLPPVLTALKPAHRRLIALIREYAARIGSSSNPA